MLEDILNENKQKIEVLANETLQDSCIHNDSTVRCTKAKDVIRFPKNTPINVGDTIIMDGITYEVIVKVDSILTFVKIKEIKARGL